MKRIIIATIAAAIPVSLLWIMYQGSIQQEYEVHEAIIEVKRQYFYIPPTEPVEFDAALAGMILAGIAVVLGFVAEYVLVTKEESKTINTNEKKSSSTRSDHGGIIILQQRARRTWRARWKPAVPGTV